MQKKKTLNANMKTYLYFDDSHPAIAEFAKAWLKSKKGDPLAFPPTGAQKIEERVGFVGSGSSAWLFQGVKIKVRGYANGKGFWGTDYLIYLAE